MLPAPPHNPPGRVATNGSPPSNEVFHLSLWPPIGIPFPITGLLFEAFKGPLKTSPPRPLSGSPPKEARGLGPSWVLGTETAGMAGAAITAPPIKAGPSVCPGRVLLVSCDDPADTGDPEDEEDNLIPFFALPVLILLSLVVAEVVELSDDLVGPLPLARFKGVKGVRVV